MAKKTQRKKALTVRLTDEEYQLFLQSKKGTLSNWIRESCLMRINQKSYDPDLLFQLAKIGGNLNQVAKHLNQSKDDLEKTKGFLLLAKIHEQLSELQKL